MKVKASTTYLNVKIEIEDDVDPKDGSGRANVIKQLKYAIDNIGEHFGADKLISGESINPTVEVVEDGEYLKPTPNQITYLRKLGVAEKTIEKIKTKSEASALITQMSTRSI